MKIRSDQRALDDFNRIKTMFSNLAAVLEDRAEVGSIESAAAAAEKHRDEVRQELDQAKQFLAGTRKQIDDDRAAAQAEIQQWRDTAAREIAAQHADSGAQMAEQQAKAQQVLDDANEQARRIVLGAENAAAAIAQRSKLAQEQLDSLNIAVAAAQQALDAATTDLHKIEQHKAELRAKLG